MPKQRVLRATHQIEYKMCCNRSKPTSLRSSSAVTSKSPEVIEFLNSDDYRNYLENFGTTPMLNKSRLLTFNGTITQGMFIPITQSEIEASAILTYYNLGLSKYVSIVISSTDDLKNIVDLSGEIHVYTTLKEIILRGDFVHNSLVTLDQPPIVPPQGVSIGYGD